MHISSSFLTVFFTVAVSVSAHDSNDNEQSTITQSAFLACATGKARTKYESCSSSVSSKIDQCGDSDLGCACSLANDGLKCLTSACPSQTTDLCAASVVLKGLCALGNAPGPSLTSAVTCPSESDINAFVATFLPSDIASFILSGVGQSIPSGINDLIVSGVPFWNGPTTVNGEGGSGNAVNTITAPSATGAANGAFVGLKRRTGEWEGVRIFLVSGICVSVGIALLAAFL